jgi:hypothetical protein
MRRESSTFLIAALILCVMSSCESDTNLAPKNTGQIEVQDIELFRVSLESLDLQMGPVDFNANKKDASTRITLRSNSNIKTNGHYNTVGGHTITFSAIQNSGGVHGNGHITGPYYIDVDFKSACINKIGNRATIGGEVTSLYLGEEPTNIQLDIGWYIYFAVEDNGEGSNADPDRYHNETYTSPPAYGPLCIYLGTDNTFYWPENEWIDISGPGGQIQVQ